MSDHEEAIGRLKGHVAGAFAMALDPRTSDLTLVASHPPSFEVYQTFSDGRASSCGPSIKKPLRNGWPWRDSAFSLLQQAAAFDSGFTLPLIMALEAGSVMFQNPGPGHGGFGSSDHVAMSCRGGSGLCSTFTWPG